MSALIPPRSTPNPHQYYAVPRSPTSPRRARTGRSAASGTSRRDAGPSRGGLGTTSRANEQVKSKLYRDTMRAVATGVLGNGYGPYSYEPAAAEYAAYHQSTNRYPHHTSDPYPRPNPQLKPRASRASLNTSSVPAFRWDIAESDAGDPVHHLHHDPAQNAAWDSAWTIWSLRGWASASALFIMCAGLVFLFAGYPIILYVLHHDPRTFLAVGVNATGQMPVMPGMPVLVDPHTPASARTRVGTDGKDYILVFSDEFEVDGRSFYPGDDPFWEAVDLNYWPTGDVEWYDPSAVTTANGKMVITMTETLNHDLNFMSGMVTSWNQICFTTGYVEVSVSMPGSPRAPGLWPAAWTMGNLGRAGYGATTDGLWPYTYDSCDLGTFPGQADHDHHPPAAAGLSFLSGQRLSACTCLGSDHPGPSVSKGRGAPEIDIFETIVDHALWRGQVSQTGQFAPMNHGYELTKGDPPATTVYNASITEFNSYRGSPYQQAASALTYIDGQNYNDTGYAPYGFEWWSDPSDRDAGYITWFSEGQKTWGITAATVGPDPLTNVSQRPISEEPHYLIMNLGMSPGFQGPDFEHMRFPAKMYIDYVRVYQREDVGTDALTCDPASYPTSSYINKHMKAYTNPNLTMWTQANQTFPRNSLWDGC